jgi:uncharacterized membrane protein
MNQVTKPRIESIDILRGVVMVLMALDHTRDYFHLGALVNDPTDLATTTPVIFLTRFITHFCAPVFVFFAGTSAFLYGSRKTKPVLSKFLITRGLWLVFVEIVIMNFIWFFDIRYSTILLQIIFAIGVSMIVLGILIYLPQKAILILALVLIAGHNLLDGIKVEGKSFSSIVWYMLHQHSFIEFSENFVMIFDYPVLPWIGVMALGYCFGGLYTKDFNVSMRKKWLLYLGLGSTVLFFVLRGINIYGDLVPWTTQKNAIYTIMSFFNVTKYPPSLSFLLITLGLALLVLYATERLKNKFTDFFLVFGRVPFFFYVLHALTIHLFALLGLLVTGGDWKIMILDWRAIMLSESVLADNELAGYGYPLWAVYLIWIGIVLLLFPLSKKYMIYKANNKDKWWLSYL